MGSHAKTLVRGVNVTPQSETLIVLDAVLLRLQAAAKARDAEGVLRLALQITDLLGELGQSEATHRPIAAIKAAQAVIARALGDLEETGIVMERAAPLPSRAAQSAYRGINRGWS